jgi:hypothetical protein
MLVYNNFMLREPIWSLPQTMSVLPWGWMLQHRERGRAPGVAILDLSGEGEAEPPAIARLPPRRWTVLAEASAPPVDPPPSWSVDGTVSIPILSRRFLRVDGPFIPLALLVLSSGEVGEEGRDRCTAAALRGIVRH